MTSHNINTAVDITANDHTTPIGESLFVHDLQEFYPKVPRSPSPRQQQNAQSSTSTSESFGTERHSNGRNLHFQRHYSHSAPENSTIMVKTSSLRSGKRSRKKHRARRTSLEAEFKNLRFLQQEVSFLRSTARRQRDELRRMEKSRAEADNEYVKAIRLWEYRNSSLSDSVESPSLYRIELLSSLQQKIRDEYGPLEDDFFATEDQLTRREFELERLENKVFQHWKYPSERSSDEDSTSSDDSEINIYHNKNTNNEPKGDDDLLIGERAVDPLLPDYASDIDEKSHPLVSKYLSKLGDVDMIQDQLWELQEEKDDLEAEKESLDLVGLSLPEEDLQWLKEFEVNEQAKSKELSRIMHEAEELKKQCIEVGLIDHDGKPTDFDRNEQDLFTGHEDNLDAHSEISEYRKFPNLLPSPARGEKGFVPRLAEGPYGIGTYINDWILHRLQSSPLDVSLLARTFEVNGGKINDRWQFDVLEFWPRDGTIEQASNHKLYSDSASIEEKSRANSIVEFTSGIKRQIESKSSDHSVISEDNEYGIISIT